VSVAGEGDPVDGLGVGVDLGEVIVLIPSMVANCSSRTSVISVSTTDGLAPR
jgi:hypothetical protein